MSQASHEDRLGEELDEFLRALQSGQAEVPPPSSREAAELRAVVEGLHCLADFAGMAWDAAEASGVAQSIGKYRVRRQLGQGGQSTTLLAFDPELQRDVVIKLYHAGEAQGQAARVLHEGRALARLASPHLARCLEVDLHEGRPYLVLEYIPGTALDEAARRRRFSTDEVTNLMIDLAEGLEAVHRAGLIHRDLKPGNVLLGDDGRARIVDFGLAVFGQCSVPSVTGTAAYMAPEQARGETDRVGVRSDIFGLGSILYELISGQPPFAGADRAEALARAREGAVAVPRQVRRRFPAGLIAICLRCLSLDPQDRFASAAALQAALRRWQQTRRWRRQAVTATCAVSLVAAGCLLWGLLAPEPSPLTTTGISVSSRAPVRLEALPRDARRLFLLDDRLRQDFWMRVDIQNAAADAWGVMQLRGGDRITLRVEVERDCYLTVLSCGPDPPAQLFPLPPFEDVQAGWVAAGQPRTIPPPAPAGETYAGLRAVPSRGKEALCIIASTVPVSLVNDSAGQPLIEYRTAHEQAQLRARLRGLIRQRETETHAVSQVLIPYAVMPPAAPP